MEQAAKHEVGKAYDAHFAPLNTYFENIDVNDGSFGWQGWMLKKVLDDAVATSIGSPVGSTKASGGNIVTPDQSDAGAAGILGNGGGLCPFAVAAAVTRYGWIQVNGINLTIAKTTGALAAGDLGTWTADDTIAVVADGTEEFVFAHCLVVAASGSVPAGGLLLY